MRFTRNPDQRAAASCMLGTVILSIAGAAVLNLVAYGVALILALVAYAQRDMYRA